MQRRPPRQRAPAPAPVQAFERLEASVLFCDRCRAPQPVRERLLLILPDGELYEYLCSACGASVGRRNVTAPPPPILIAP